MDPGPRFEEHIKTAHPFKCENCDQRYVEAEKLRKHIKSHRQKGKSKTKPVESVKERNSEGKAIGHQSSSSSKTQHSAIKSSEKPKAPKSNVNSSSESTKSRENPIRIMESSKVSVKDYWKCNWCEAPFLVESDMKAHEVKTHPHSCDLCENKFMVAADLKKHKVGRHNASGLGIVKCGQCGELTDNKSLSSHNKALHSFNCDRCDLKFVQKGKLIKHKIEDHGEGCWVNKPNSDMPKVTDVKSAKSKTIPKKLSKLKEGLWETVQDKKMKAKEARAKPTDPTSKKNAESQQGIKEISGSSPTIIKAGTSREKRNAVEGSAGEEEVGKKSTDIASVGEKVEECLLCKQVEISLIWLLDFLLASSHSQFLHPRISNISNTGASLETDGQPLEKAPPARMWT